MEGFVSFLSGLLFVVSVIVSWIIAYKRIRDDWLHGLLIFIASLTIILTSSNPWQTLTASLPWNTYAQGASLSFADSLIWSIATLIVIPWYVEVMWWGACLLRLIARHIPTPKQP